MDQLWPVACNYSLCRRASLGELEQATGWKLRERKPQAEVSTGSRSARDFSCQFPGRADPTGENKNVSPTTNSEPDYLRLCCLGRTATPAGAAVSDRQPSLRPVHIHFLPNKWHALSIFNHRGKDQSLA